MMGMLTEALLVWILQNTTPCPMESGMVMLNVIFQNLYKPLCHCEEINIIAQYCLI